jgi:competence protein CoiA
MKYALVGGQRVEAYRGGSAMCPVCGGEVIAKCGTHRVAHWAHRGVRDCDSWAETETVWHRAWKSHFPAECQEVIQHDAQSGERHIADVRTTHGLVIEFQHSHLDPREQAARERFYGNMVWVVDGTRLQRDYPRFNKGMDDFRRTNMEAYFLVAFPEECFPASRTCGRTCRGCWTLT